MSALRRRRQTLRARAESCRSCGRARPGSLNATSRLRTLTLCDCTVKEAGQVVHCIGARPRASSLASYFELPNVF
jgi:hypothetical protein